MKNENSTLGVQTIAETVTNIIGNINLNHKTTIIEPVQNGEFHVPKLVKTFRGRDEELTKLTTWFFDKNKPMVAICGLPGYGKTELAKNFIRNCRNQQRLLNILWINSETTDSLEHSFRELLKWLGERSDLDISSVVQKVHLRLNDKSNMFVFDNARDRQSVRDFEPDGEARCLVTSHIKDWGDDVLSLELTPLSLDGALAVLRAVLDRRFQNEHELLYKALATTLSCVPLALQVAAAYIRQEMRDLQEEFSLREYVQALQHSCEQLIKKAIPNSSANPYTISIYEAVRKSLLKIKKLDNDKSRLALNILHICAYLNPDKIFSTDLQKFPYIHNLLSSDAELMRALSLLRNYSFIHISNGQIFIHRLIQDTLILYQIQNIKGNQNHFYFACLESLLCNINTSHGYFILKYAEKHVDTFLNFYCKHTSDIISKDTFLNHLIAMGYEVFLNQIFEDLGAYGYATTIINKHLLLHEAVRCKQYGVQEMLLARDAIVDLQNERGDTPLFIAADCLDMRAVEMLTEYKADVNAINLDGEFVLHRVIATSGRPQHNASLETACEILQWLVSHGACTDVVDLQGGTLVHSAAWVLNADLVYFLVCDLQLNVNALDHNEQTPLYHVSKKWSADKGRRLRTAKCLLDLGASLEILDQWNQTPAEHARSQGLNYLAKYYENPSDEYLTNHTSQADADILISLVATGETLHLIRKLDELGENAVKKINEYCLLHEAVQRGQLDVLQILLARGAYIDSRDDRNDTPLLVAARKLDLLAVEELARHGANVNAVNSNGRSVLHALILALSRPKQGNRQDEVCVVMRTLAKCGTSTHVEMNHGESLLHCAAFALVTDVIHFLIREFHLDVNAVDTDGQTPLFYITYGLEHWHVEESRGINTAQCLLWHGALLDIVDSDGLTPAENARTRGFKDLETYLKIPKTGQQTNIDTYTASDIEVDIDTYTVTETQKPSTTLVTPSTQQVNTDKDSHKMTEKLECPSTSGTVQQVCKQADFTPITNKELEISSTESEALQQLNTIPDKTNTELETSSTGSETQQRDTDKDTQNTTPELKSPSVGDDAQHISNKETDAETSKTTAKLITPLAGYATHKHSDIVKDTGNTSPSTELESLSEKDEIQQPSGDTANPGTKFESLSEENKINYSSSIITDTPRISTELGSLSEKDEIHPPGSDKDTETNTELESSLAENTSQQLQDTIMNAESSMTSTELESLSKEEEIQQSHSKAETLWWRLRTMCVSAVCRCRQRR